MSVEENKKAFYRAFEEIWNKGDYSVIPEVISPDYTNNYGHKGLDEFEQLVKGSRTTFPDLHYSVDEIIGEGDTLAARLTLTGTFLGKMGDIQPTGNRVNLTSAFICRFAHGKCIETTVFSDSAVLYQQLGSSPPTG